MSVLLYMTPRYRQEMISHVTEEMNRIYRLYKKRHPNFKGKVSVYGHSLGSLLAFDILSNQDGLRHETHEGMKQSHSEVDLSELLGSNSGPVRMNGLIQRRGTIKFKKLEFEVQSLFGM